MKKVIFFVDGENFRKSLEEIFVKKLKQPDFDIFKFNINKFFKEIFKKEKVTLVDKYYYAAKIKLYKETKKRSEELIFRQRKLKNILQKNSFKYIISGNVNRYIVDDKYIFVEKGVDVKLATDLISFAVDCKMELAYVFSSDSDLIPAINEVKRRGVQVVYLGFEDKKNYAIINTTDKTMLVKSKYLLKFYK